MTRIGVARMSRRSSIITPLRAGVVLVKTEFRGWGGKFQRQVISERPDDRVLRVVVESPPLASYKRFDPELKGLPSGPALKPEVEAIDLFGHVLRRPDNLVVFSAQQPQALLSRPVVPCVNCRVAGARNP